MIVKYICLKDIKISNILNTNGYNNELYEFLKNEIYEFFVGSYTLHINGIKAYKYYNKYISANKINENFKPLSEFREDRINKILNE